jgi:hypothetical protein
MYADNNGLWLTAADGHPRLIVADPRAFLSPDRRFAILRECNHCGNDYQLVDLITGHKRAEPQGVWYAWSPDSRRIYFIDPGPGYVSDIWVEDVATGDRRNLSNTPGRHESGIAVWPEQPEYLFFYSWPIEVTADGEGWLGYPTVMKIDGTEYDVLSDDLAFGEAALSPDGQTIAYSTHGAAWYYRLGTKAHRFPWQNFGLTELKNIALHLPSWSSDGQRIAWAITGEDQNGLVHGVAVFDLQSGQARFLRNWDWLEWSPSRQWTLGSVHSPRPGIGYGRWVADTNGEAGHLLTEVYNSIDSICYSAWNPDEQWLAFNCVNSTIGDGVWLAEASTGRLLRTSLPPDAEVRDWIRLEP